MDQRWIQRFIRICLLNLLLVSIWGMLMRYKIGFEFPVFSQKNLLHAHSHFAFSGWASLLIMVLMLSRLQQESGRIPRMFKRILTLYLFSSYGMLISFTMQGYGLFSIIFSTISLFASLLFSLNYFSALTFKQNQASRWLAAALLFNVISFAGTLFLSYMMASGNVNQHHYLASVYWYLHFQYNGFFFFALGGLFIDWLRLRAPDPDVRTAFRLFFYSCIPAYGLSVLWLPIPDWMYWIVSMAAIAQVIALMLIFKRVQAAVFGSTDVLIKILLGCAAFALSVKILLQAGSVIPAVNKLAFGFRPIVIAYLHLVLLAFTSLFLIGLTFLQHYLPLRPLARTGILMFTTGVFLNEFALGVQGIAAFSYTLIPVINESLFAVALLMFLGLLLLNFSFLGLSSRSDQAEKRKISGN